jgi:hypothetical protein
MGVSRPAEWHFVVQAINSRGQVSVQSTAPRAHLPFNSNHLLQHVDRRARDTALGYIQYARRPLLPSWASSQALETSVSSCHWIALLVLLGSCSVSLQQVLFSFTTLLTISYFEGTSTYSIESLFLSSDVRSGSCEITNLPCLIQVAYPGLASRTMPQPTLLPTPASSTDISGQDGTKQLASLQTCFELPPAALSHDQSPPEEKRTPRQVPLQASENLKSRRRSSAIMAASKDPFTLPPPPTRTRKIIQMKPRAQQQEPCVAPAAAGALHDESDQPQPTTAGNKRKQAPSTTTAAGRKMARKTAHSLIERRRRSKMNEEFGTLKDMVPACTGEMHKLAILQVSRVFDLGR